MRELNDKILGVFNLPLCYVSFNNCVWAVLIGVNRFKTCSVVSKLFYLLSFANMIRRTHPHLHVVWPRIASGKILLEILRVHQASHAVIFIGVTLP